MPYADPEKKRAYHKAHYEANKEKVAAYQKAYRGANKEKIQTYKKTYYEANKEKVIARNKAYKEANPEKIAARNKAYYEANKEKVIARQKSHYEANKEKVAAQKKVYQKDFCYIETYVDRIPPTDKPEWNGLCVSVACKYCGKRFMPTMREIESRVYKVNTTHKGESNFYCSDKCKSDCTVFNQQKYPKTKEEHPQVTILKMVRSCQTDHLKQNQCDSHGYNYCEKCGDIIDVELHHTLPVAVHGTDAISSDSHILLCAGCHTQLHSECS